MSRPSKFKPEFNEQVEILCVLGATDAHLATFFEVTEQTINNWKNDYPEFFESVKKAKQSANTEVAQSLFKKALGYNYVEQVAIKVKTGQYTEDVKVVELEKHVPADTMAIMYFLNNREKGNWVQKQNVDVTSNGETIDAVIKLGNGTEIKL